MGELQLHFIKIMSLCVDELLSRFQKLCIQMKTESIGTGYLDPLYFIKKDIPKNAKIELPFWIIENLFLKGMCIINPQPKQYTKPFFQIWCLEPEYITLPDLYYHLGQNIAAMIKRPIMIEFFMFCFDNRQKKMYEVIDYKLTTKAKKYSQKLTELEKRIMKFIMELKKSNRNIRLGKELIPYVNEVSPILRKRRSTSL